MKELSLKVFENFWKNGFDVLERAKYLIEFELGSDVDYCISQIEKEAKELELACFKDFAEYTPGLFDVPELKTVEDPCKYAKKIEYLELASPFFFSSEHFISLQQVGEIYIPLESFVKIISKEFNISEEFTKYLIKNNAFEDFSLTKDEYIFYADYDLYVLRKSNI